ncbi:ATP-grasp domain-containing protein [Deinococcus misasensis]|uniref:ATP-grasp domain-containing protein n=1 Tax=Deinococcus misasensis TaxID=392413 RepID=UPI0005513D9C|nr:ATP-grasp domain-containing protein [Deinococcus misasensis]
MKTDAIVVLGRRDLTDDLRTILTFNLPVVLLNPHITLQDALLVDWPIEVDLNDEPKAFQALERVRERHHIKTVFTINQYRLTLAAKMREHLGISHGMSVKAAEQSGSKVLTRKVLQEHHLSPIEYRVVTSPAEALKVLPNLTLPVIVKPANDAGSNLVQKCETMEEVWEAVSRIRSQGQNWVNQPFDREILLEEFLEGPEYSVEAASDQSETRIVAITEKHTVGAIEAGHLVPAALNPQDQEAIGQLVVDVLNALGIQDTVTHTEVKLTPQGPRIIEVNSRVGGDHIHELVHHVTGTHLVQLSLHLHLGGTLRDHLPDLPRAPSAMARFLVAEASGVFDYQPEALEHSDQVVGWHLTHLPGRTVKQSTSNYDRLGYFICHGTPDQSALTVAHQVLQDLQLTVKPPQLT